MSHIFGYTWWLYGWNATTAHARNCDGDLYRYPARRAGDYPANPCLKCLRIMDRETGFNFAAFDDTGRLEVDN